jgi:hypothetical protein
MQPATLSLPSRSPFKSEIICQSYDTTLNTGTTKPVAPCIGLIRGPVSWGRVRLRARARPPPKASGDAPPRFRLYRYDHRWAKDFMA